MALVNKVIISIWAVIASVFGVHHPQVLDMSSSTVAQEIVQTHTDTSVTDSSLATPSDWKTFSYPTWGFQISYPPTYRFLDSLQNAAGPKHYLIPQRPPAESGNYGKIIEIADIQGTSTVKAIIQVLLGALQPKDLKDLESMINAQFASSSSAYSAQGAMMSLGSFTIDGVSYPAASLQTSKIKETRVYYLQPPQTIYGKVQLPRLFIIDYAPGNDDTLVKIASSIRSIPLVLPNESLYISAEKSKDTSWCDRIKGNDILKDQCYINVRGPIYDWFPVDFSAIPVNSGGTGGTVTGTTLSITGGKGSNVWLAGGVTTKTNTNYMEFDTDLVNGEQAQSLLTVYLNTTKIGIVDGRVDPMGGHFEFPLYLEGVSNLNSLNPTLIPPGLYTLSFRLDTFSDGDASAKISNVKVGLIH